MLANPITQVLMPQRAFNAPPTTLVSPATAIPDGAEVVQLSVDRSLWTGPRTDPNNALEARMEVSLDGGATWQFLASFTTPGGIIYQGATRTNPQPAGALPTTASSMTVGLPNPEISGRKARATLNVLQALTTTITAVWS